MSKIEYRHIGKNAERSDAKDIVLGKAIFLDDYKMKDVIYGKVLRSPHASAKIVSIDISEAEALPGVRAVVYYGNMPEKCKKWGLSHPPLVPVLGETVSYVGDAVALVAADTAQIADAAVDLIKVKYEVLPAVFRTVDAIKPDAPVVHKEFESNVIPNVPIIGEQMMMHLKRGNVEKAFEECDVIVEGDNEYGSLGSPLPMEPPGVIAQYKDGRLMTWATSQCTEVFKVSLYGRTRRTPVDTVSFNVGGGFGNKAGMPTTALYASLLATVSGKTVKMNMTKTEQLLCHDERIGMYSNVKIGLKDGLVHAVQGFNYLDCGSLNDCGQWQMGVGLGECQIAFGKCQNWDVEGKMVMTNHVQTGSARGFGGQEMKAALIPVAMQAVRKADIDPVEFYMNNFAQSGDGWYWREEGTWFDCREQDYAPVMKSTAEKFDWRDKWKGWNVPTRVEGNKAIGVGVSVHGNADVGEDNCEAYVRIEPRSGFVYLHCGVPETGAGQHSNMRKFVAEVLDMALEKVIVVPMNTEVLPHEQGPMGSRCTITTGTAVTRAAEDARRKLLTMAATDLHASPDDLGLKDNRIFYKNRPDVTYPAVRFMPFGCTITGLGTYYANYSKSNFCIFFAEVEVDLETGIAKLKKITSGTDVGQIIDPATLEMQLHGGIGAAAADTGLLDENVLDISTGRVLTGNLIDYKWRTFNDFPYFDYVIEESLPEISRFKAVGFGEISGAPGPAAIMMAISNAIGKDFCNYPATPESILKALGKV